MLAAELLLLAFAVALIGAAESQIKGNPCCPSGTQQFVIDEPNFSKSQYVFNLGSTGFSITFTNFNGPEGTIGSWSATTPIREIIMKGGKGGATIYTYGAGVKEDSSGLHTTWNNKCYGAISHIYICVPPVPSPPPAPVPLDIKMCVLQAIHDIDYAWTLQVHDSSADAECVVEEHLEDNLELVKVTKDSYKVNGHFTVTNPACKCSPKIKEINVWIGTHKVPARCNPVCIGRAMPKTVECDFQGVFSDQPDAVKVEVIVNSPSTCVKDYTLTTPITVWTPCEEKDKCVNVTVTTNALDVVITGGDQHNICNPPNLGAIIATIPVLETARPCVKFYVKVNSCPAICKSFCVAVPKHNPRKLEVLLGPVTGVYQTLYIWNYTHQPQTACTPGDMCSDIASDELTEFFDVHKTRIDIKNILLTGPIQITNPTCYPVKILDIGLALGAHSISGSIDCGKEYHNLVLAKGDVLSCTFSADSSYIPLPTDHDQLHLEVITDPASAGVALAPYNVVWEATPIHECVMVTITSPSTLVIPGLHSTQELCDDDRLAPFTVTVHVEQKADLIIEFDVDVESKVEGDHLIEEKFNLTFCGKIDSNLVISASTPNLDVHHAPAHWGLLPNVSGCVNLTDDKFGVACLGTLIKRNPNAPSNPNWFVTSDFNISNPDDHCPALITSVSVLIDGKLVDHLECHDAASQNVTFPYTLPYGHLIHCIYDAGGVGVPTTLVIMVVVDANSLVGPAANVTVTPLTSSPAPPGNSCVMIGLTKETAVQWCDGDAAIPCIPVNETTIHPTGQTCFNYTVHVWSLDLSVEQAETGPFQLCFCPPPPLCTCVHTYCWWKEHCKAWPADWKNKAFFCSGKKWHDVFEIQDRQGKACYWKLAKVYVAAVFNSLTGSCHPQEVDDALVLAESSYLNKTSVCQGVKCQTRPHHCNCDCNCNKCFDGADEAALLAAYEVLSGYSLGHIDGAPACVKPCPPCP